MRGPKRAHAIILAVFSLLVFVAFTPSASAQDNATLAVYVETIGGDKAFSFVSSPSALGDFQVATQNGGGVKIFDLPVGNYSLHQNLFFDGWVPQEAFIAGTGNWTTSSDVDATFNVASTADVFYYRVTMRNSFIPENPSLPLLFACLAFTGFFAVLFKRKKRATASAFAVLLCGLIVFASVSHVHATPDKFTQIGTSGDDTQIQLGTPNNDVILQFGFGGNDTQYSSAADGNDVTIQNGGSGRDSITVRAGSGNDYVVQEGGTEDDVLSAEGGLGNDTLILVGGSQNDTLTASGGEDNDNIVVKAGEGNDIITVDAGIGDDKVDVDGGPGNDNITYGVSQGLDTIRVDGGADLDSLIINSLAHSLMLFDALGQAIYQVGSGGSSITVVNVEQITVLGSGGAVLYKNY